MSKVTERISVSLVLTPQHIGSNRCEVTQKDGRGDEKSSNFLSIAYIEKSSAGAHTWLSKYYAIIRSLMILRQLFRNTRKFPLLRRVKNEGLSEKKDNRLDG
jgi:hypothetical protein